MSWLAKSLANSLLLDDREDDDAEDDEIATRRRKEELGGEADPGGWGGGEHEEEGEGAYDDPSRGVKEDLSELTKTLTRQFWGVASFLAPPPTSTSDAASGGRGDPAPSSLEECESTEAYDTPPSIAGMRSDLAEIGGRFRSGISKLSSHKAVTEGISRIKSTFLPFGSGDEEYGEEGESEEGSERRLGGGAIGVTEEVMVFVRNISMHPETWLDFPLLLDDEESDDFDISDAQQEHALAVESLSPRLAALRIELCPSHMSEGCFWKIYFVLLHPRLSKHDAELLSTPQIVEARALLLQKLQSQTKLESEVTTLDASHSKVDDNLVRPQEFFVVPNDAYETSYPIKEEIGTPASSSNIESEKHPIHLTNVEVIDKSVIEEEPVKQLVKDHTDSAKVYAERFEEEIDDWLEQEAEEMGASGTTTIPLVDDEDVSFSDLEEDETITAKPKK